MLCIFITLHVSSVLPSKKFLPVFAFASKRKNFLEVQQKQSKIFLGANGKNDFLPFSLFLPVSSKNGKIFGKSKNQKQISVWKKQKSKKLLFGKSKNVCKNFC